MGGEGVTVPVQGNPPPYPVEQAEADLVLQSGNLSADPGLGKAEAFRGARDAAGFGDRQKRFQVVWQRHRGSRLSS